MFGHMPALYESSSSLCHSFTDLQSVRENSRNITAASPIFLLIQWREARSEATGKTSREKDRYRGHKCICAEPLVDDWFHKIIWLVRLSNSYSHKTTSLESLEKCLGFLLQVFFGFQKGQQTRFWNSSLERKGDFEKGESGQEKIEQGFWKRARERLNF